MEVTECSVPAAPVPVPALSPPVEVSPACSGEGLAQLQPGNASSLTSENRIFHKPEEKGQASPVLFLF